MYACVAYCHTETEGGGGRESGGEAWIYVHADHYYESYMYACVAYTIVSHMRDILKLPVVMGQSRQLHPRCMVMLA